MPLLHENFPWMIKALSLALPCGVAMSGMVKAIGRGLFAAGLLLLLLYFVGLHLTGFDALRDAPRILHATPPLPSTVRRHAFIPHQLRHSPREAQVTRLAVAPPMGGTVKPKL